jgi:hypothetical protein
MVVIISIPAAARAQPVGSSAPRVEVSGGVGYAKTWDDEGGIGPGAMVGATVVFPLTPSIAAGATVARVSHDRDTGQGLHFEGDSTLFMATGKFTFGSRRVQPVLTASFGLLRYRGTLTSGPPTNLPSFVPVPDIPVERIERRSSSTVFGGTSGVDVWITRHLAVRPSIGLQTTQPQDDFAPWAIIHGGLAVATRW